MKINDTPAEATVNFCEDDKFYLEAHLRSDGDSRMFSKSWLLPYSDADELLRVLDGEFLNTTMIISGIAHGKRETITLRFSEMFELDDFRKDLAHAFEAAEDRITAGAEVE